MAISYMSHIRYEKENGDTTATTDIVCTNVDESLNHAVIQSFDGWLRCCYADSTFNVIDAKSLILIDIVT